MTAFDRGYGSPYDGEVCKTLNREPVGLRGIEVSFYSEEYEEYLDSIRWESDGGQ